MKFCRAALAGLLIGTVAGCAALPTGFSSRSKSNIQDLFTSNENVVVANQAKAANGSKVNDSGLRIRKSERGNMKSYVVRGQRYHTLENSDGYSARGLASWYGPNFHGQVASNGETYDMYKMTAAHKTLPLPTYARVTHIDSGKSVVVKINDRGPFSGDRLIDLSFAAALQLGMVNDGTATVDIEALTPMEVAELSGPDNDLNVDFYKVETVAETAPAGTLLEQATVKPEAAMNDKSESNSAVAAGELLSLASLETEIDQTQQQMAGDQAANQQVPPESAASTEGVFAKVDEEIKVMVNAESTTEVRRAAGLPVDLMENTNAGQPVSLSGVGAVKTAQQPIQQARQNTEKQSVSTDISSSNSNGSASAAENGPGYFIQAGVFADVDDAEKVAIDVVLTVPLEEVHVKPLKDTNMYRITVGPIVAADHAAEVSGKLEDAGLDNFTVKVKSIRE